MMLRVIAIRIGRVGGGSTTGIVKVMGFVGVDGVVEVGIDLGRVGEGLRGVVGGGGGHRVVVGVEGS